MQFLCLKTESISWSFTGPFNLADKWCRGCSATQTCNGDDDTFCITVTMPENSKNSSEQLDVARDLVIPFLLGTVVKGWLCTKDPLHPALQLHIFILDNLHEFSYISLNASFVGENDRKCLCL